MGYIPFLRDFLFVCLFDCLFFCVICVKGLFVMTQYLIIIQWNGLSRTYVLNCAAREGSSVKVHPLRQGQAHVVTDTL